MQFGNSHCHATIDAHKNQCVKGYSKKRAVQKEEFKSRFPVFLDSPEHDTIPKGDIMLYFKMISQKDTLRQDICFKQTKTPTRQPGRGWKEKINRCFSSDI
jgi:hypothetical protein